MRVCFFFWVFFLVIIWLLLDYFLFFLFELGADGVVFFVFVCIWAGIFLMEVINSYKISSRFLLLGFVNLELFFFWYYNLCVYLI